MADAPPTPAPGWYPDPKMADTRRYWDGASWSDNVAPMLAPADDDKTGLILAGYVLAVLLPPLGFVAGILLPGRGRQGKHQTAILVISVLLTLLWAAAVL